MLGVRSPAEYDDSARETIRDGICLIYTYVDPVDPALQEARVGYFDPATGRFTAMTEDERLILSHFAATESYVRNLPDSTYG